MPANAIPHLMLQLNVHAYYFVVIDWFLPNSGHVHIDDKVAQRYRPPPIHLEHKLLRELNEWEDIEATETGPIIERIPEDKPTT